ncbi:hypothetical protein [Pseudarthrobacter sp. NIBRBAC000502771]|uniref:hypothetical protein n=1 Tax=Pseudarthrobacter sp. NIBRBAC000502771 TaxID=2590774 RepID=UPI00113200E2|nr:hypothetical protein [Pseudarthrobacter sp. NIBRBAC000502771]QDG61250.1 hypothetical protein NIBR502771_02285 [Pseudarthrobacter sp. NIBRBAC000502771]
MDPTLQLIVNVGAAATAIAAIIGLPLAFVKGWPLLKRAVAIGGALEKLPEMAVEISALTIGQRTQAETLAHQNDQLAIIKHEVEFNNGSSVKDAVVRTEKATAALGEKLDAHLSAPKTTINVTGVAPHE